MSIEIENGEHRGHSKVVSPEDSKIVSFEETRPRRINYLGTKLWSSLSF